MKQHWHVMAAAVIVVAATHGAGPGAAFAGQKPLQQRIDPSTGAHVRVFSGATARDLRVEIEDPSVLIRKEFTNLSSLTTIVSGDERISFVVDRTGLTVTSGQERVEVRRGRPDLADDARGLVAESPSGSPRHQAAGPARGRTRPGAATHRQGDATHAGVRLRRYGRRP